MSTYDAIVIGTGGVGSAALYHLARRGLRVLGLDRFPGGHDRGSSHGQTRIIRQAYFEHPDYVPLLKRVLNHLDQAVQAGAELRTDVSVAGWTSDAGVIEVSAANEVFESKRLVIAAGAWSESLLSDLGIALPVRRKHLHWYHCDDPHYLRDQGCCAFFYETPGGVFYGFPQVDSLGVKVSQHSGGTIVDDPLADDRSIERADRKRIESFLRRHLPGVSDRPNHHDVCYYTMSADEHFVVDRHPDHDGVAFAAGLSGHGFKFTSALGQILAELVTDGTTTLPIDFLAWSRPALACA